MQETRVSHTTCAFLQKNADIQGHVARNPDPSPPCLGVPLPFPLPPDGRKITNIKMSTKLLENEWHVTAKFRPTPPKLAKFCTLAIFPQRSKEKAQPPLPPPRFSQFAPAFGNTQRIEIETKFQGLGAG